MTDPPSGDVPWWEASLQYFHAHMPGSEHLQISQPPQYLANVRIIERDLAENPQLWYHNLNHCQKGEAEAMWIEEFVKRNPYFLTHRQIPIEEIVAGLKEYLGAVELPEVPSMPMHRFNAVHLPSNEVLGLSEEELRIQAVKIPITERSAHYTLRNYVPQPDEDFIYLVYENQVGYCYSNSNQLFLETAIARGLHPRDAAEKGEAYFCYLGYLKRFLETCIAPYVKEEE